jgi:hypothetical protein
MIFTLTVAGYRKSRRWVGEEAQRCRGESREGKLLKINEEHITS